MVNGIRARLRIDLNMLHGTDIVTCRDFLVGGGVALPDLQKGDLVEVVEAEGDSYLATVKAVGGDNDLLVYLTLDLESMQPAVSIEGMDQLMALPTATWQSLKIKQSA